MGEEAFSDDDEWRASREANVKRRFDKSVKALGFRSRLNLKFQNSILLQISSYIGEGDRRVPVFIRLFATVGRALCIRGFESINI